jgi:hypothetical protein
VAASEQQRGWGGGDVSKVSGRKKMGNRGDLLVAHINENEFKARFVSAIRLARYGLKRLKLCLRVAYTISNFGSAKSISNSEFVEVR